MSIIYRPAGRAGEYSEYAVNLYGGCDHHCPYCYVPLARHITPEKFYGAGATPYKNVLKKLAADCRRLQGAITTPIMLSFTSDAYQHSEAGHQTTRQAIRLLKQHGFRICVLTKAGMRATRDFDLLDAGDVMAATLTLINEADSLKWEPHAALPSDRIEFLKAAKRRGMETWASLEPVIDPEQTLELIQATRGIVDLYKIGTINYVKVVSEKIDWTDFVREAVAAVIAGNQAYYLKDDLLKYADPKTPQSHNPHQVCIMHSAKDMTEPSLSLKGLNK
jgi:DNA repair photolyase